MSRPQSVAGLVALRVGLVMVLFSIVTAVGIVSSIFVGRALTDYQESVTPLVESVDELRVAFADGQSAYRGYLATGEATYREAFHTARQAITDAAAQFDRLAEPIPQPERQELAQATATWTQLTDAGTAQRAAGHRVDLAASTAAGTTVGARLDTIESFVHALRAERRAGYEQLMTATVWGTVGAALLSLLVTMVLSVQIIRQVARPIRALGDLVEAHAAGMDNVRADPGSGSREVRAVAGAFNALADIRTSMLRRQALDLTLHQATEEIAGIFAQTSLTEEGWSPACGQLGSALDVDGVYLYSWSCERGFVPLGQWVSASAEPAEPIIPAAPEQVHQALRVPRTTGSAEELTQAFPCDLAQAAQEAGIRSWALRPLLAGDELVGLASIWCRQDRAWDPIEVEAIDRFAFYAARAISEHRYVESLRELDALKSDFLATTSHELRTPLTSISGYVEMLSSGDFGELSPMQSRACEIIDENATRLRTLVEDLLILNELESSPGHAVGKPFGIGDLVEQVCRPLKALADQVEVTLSLQDDSGGTQVSGDRYHLGRALTNIVGNGIKFSLSGDRVHVSVTTDGAVVRITCSDTGIGIPVKDQDELFTRFHRASNAAEAQIQGAGLGLSITQAVIERHRGSISVQSDLGAGTTVVVTLPRHDHVPHDVSHDISHDVPHDAADTPQDMAEAGDHVVAGPR